MANDELTLKYIPLGQVAQWGRNFKKHDIGTLCQSIKRHGFRDPLSYDKNLNDGAGGIVEGNGRDQALRWIFKDTPKDPPRGIGTNDKGEWLIPVLFGMDAKSMAAAEAYGSDHNLITFLGGDVDLSDIMRQMNSGYEDHLAELATVGELPESITGDALDALLGNAGGGDAEPEIDRAEELQEKWKVKTGDLWRIGEHRLICGDCTDAAVVERLMAGEKAGACVTDSPYGINREGIENDDEEGLRELFDGCLAVMPIENAVIINFQSPRLFPIWLDAVRDAGHKFERMLWMYKSNDVTMPWRGWLMKSEAILVSTVGSPEWKKPSEYKHDCYSINWDKETMVDIDGWHASIKPPLIVLNLIDNTTGTVYEPFSGSGTTLVACENLNRNGRGVEISEKYCAVTLERMATAFPELKIKLLDE